MTIVSKILKLIKLLPLFIWLSLLIYSMYKNNESLDLIHTNICEQDFEQVRDGKMYFTIFIDDCTNHYYPCLFISEYEALEIFKHFKSKVENQLSMKSK